MALFRALLLAQTVAGFVVSPSTRLPSRIRANGVKRVAYEEMAEQNRCQSSKVQLGGGALEGAKLCAVRDHNNAFPFTLFLLTVHRAAAKERRLGRVSEKVSEIFVLD